MSESALAEEDVYSSAPSDIHFGVIPKNDSNADKGNLMTCKPYSVVLAVLAPDKQGQVSFGITKGCISDDQAFYVLNFVLRHIVNDERQDRVRLHVTVDDTDSEKAQKVIDRGLTMAQIKYLQGPVTNRANKLPAGTTSDPTSEKSLAKVITK